MPGHLQEGFGCVVTNRFDQLFDDESDPFEVLRAAESRRKESGGGGGGSQAGGGARGPAGAQSGSSGGAGGAGQAGGGAGSAAKQLRRESQKERKNPLPPFAGGDRREDGGGQPGAPLRKEGEPAGEAQRGPGDPARGAGGGGGGPGLGSAPRVPRKMESGVRGGPSSLGPAGGREENVGWGIYQRGRESWSGSCWKGS